MTALRDPDRTELNAFAQHVAIAETLLGVERDLSGALHLQSTAEERLAPAEAWDNMWAQLGEARTIALRFGRDVSAYDAAYARSGARVMHNVRGLQIAPVARDAAVEAINALRAAFPEIVVPAPPVSGKSTQPGSPPWRPSPRVVFHLTLVGFLLLAATLLSICGT
jgi:hypothetical protein